MARTKPTPGGYRLTPAPKFNQPPYDVAVTADACNYAAPWAGLLAPCPWDATRQEFRRTDATGWTFGWVCFGDGTYLRFAIDPHDGHLIDRDSGTCEPT